MRLCIAALALFYFAVPPAQAASVDCPDGWDHQLRSHFVQRGLIASGFLDGEVGRALRGETETAIRRFRGGDAERAQQTPLSASECQSLGENFQALVRAAGLESFVFEKTGLKIHYPLALAFGQAPNIKHPTSWFEFDTADYSFGIDVFKSALYQNTPLSLQAGSLTYMKNISLFYQQTASDEATWEGVGDLTHRAAGTPDRTVRYYFHNRAFEYNGEVRGLYLKYSLAPPAWFKPAPHLAAATASPGNVVAIEREFGKLPAESIPWIVFVRAINNLIVSDFVSDNGAIEISTAATDGNTACNTGIRSTESGRRYVRVVYGTTRTLAPEFAATQQNIPSAPPPPAPMIGSLSASPLPMARLFGNDEQNMLHLGCAQLSVARTPASGSQPALHLGLLQAWAAHSDVPAPPLLLGARHLASIDETHQKYVRVVDTAANKPIERALLFVHGYNTPFDSALARAAELATRTGYAGQVYMFSWPSRARPLDYIIDADAAEGAQLALQAFMRAILQDRNVKILDVVAHSMGALQVLRALEQLQATFDRRSDAAEADKRRLRLGQVIFASPDVDSKFFREKVSALAPLSERVTVYVSRGDLILRLSRLARKGRPRAGTFGWGEVPIEITSMAANSAIHVIDVTATRPGWRRFIPDASFGHADFINNDVVNADVGQVLEAKYLKKSPTDDSIRNRGQIFCRHTYAPDGKSFYWTMRAPALPGEPLPACPL